VGIKLSNALASKITRLPHVNSFAALYEPDQDEHDLLTGDNQINIFAVLCEHDNTAITPPSPRYNPLRAGPFPFAVIGTVPMGTAVRHSDSHEHISAQHNMFI